MSWKTGTLKLDTATTLFDGLAIVSKHSLGYYEAVLSNGETLRNRSLTDLGARVIDRCIAVGLKRQQVVEVGDRAD